VSNRRFLPVIALAATAGLLVTAKYWKSRQFDGPADLKHFEGVIDYSQSTDDEVRSRLAVDAAHALERGDAKAAEELYRTIINKYPADSSAYVDLGVCLGFQKRFDESRDQYHKALDLDPRSARAYLGLGSNAYEEGRDIDAIESLQKSLELEESGLAHWILALIDDSERDDRSAIRHYEKAIESRQIDAKAAAYATKRLRILKGQADERALPGLDVRK